MPAVSVPELRAHLNLDHTAADALLAQKIDAAEAYAASFIGGPLPEPLPATIRQAVLMLSAYWYETREVAAASGVSLVPFGLHDLLQGHRVWVV